MEYILEGFAFTRSWKLHTGIEPFFWWNMIGKICILLVIEHLAIFYNILVSADCEFFLCQGNWQLLKGLIGVTGSRFKGVGFLLPWGGAPSPRSFNPN